MIRKIMAVVLPVSLIEDQRSFPPCPAFEIKEKGENDKGRDGGRLRGVENASEYTHEKNKGDDEDRPEFDKISDFFPQGDLGKRDRSDELRTKADQRREWLGCKEGSKEGRDKFRRPISLPTETPDKYP